MTNDWLTSEEATVLEQIASRLSDQGLQVIYRTQVGMEIKFLEEE